MYKDDYNSSLIVNANTDVKQVLRINPATPYSSRPNTHRNCEPADG